jgi:hypothetical protein
MAGRKSDYYREMSPVTLAPKTHNPWTNSMKRGIVSPAYDSTDLVNYKYGPSIAAAGNPTATIGWNSLTGLANSTGSHMIGLNPWHVTAGVKYINSVRVGIGVSDATYTSAWFIEVWRKDADLYRLVVRSEDFGTPGPNQYGITTLTPATPLEVTLVAGKTYFIGVRVVRKNANAAAPQFDRMATTKTHVVGQVLVGIDVDHWSDTTMPLVDVAGECDHYTATTSNLLIEVNYDSPNYLECDIATPNKAGLSYLVPVAVDRPYIVKFQDVVVADTADAVWEVIDGDSTSTNNVLDTLELDCGKSTGGQNDMICQTNTVNLPDISEVGQEGKNFDIWYVVRPADGTVDLFWVNKEVVPPAPISHATKNAGVRGTRYTLAFGRKINLTTVGTIGRMQVGVHPVVLLGDSNTYSGTALAAGFSALPAAFAKPRMWLWHGMTGSAWASIRNSFFAGTIGSADGIELIGAKCLWVGCGMGVNAAAGACLNDNDAKAVISTQAENCAGMLRYVLTGDDEVLLVGCPPYASSTDTDKYEGRMVRWLNRAYLGLALAWKCAFYNPWPDVVIAGTEGDDIPGFNATYSTDEIHYIAAGGAFIAPKIAAAYENATIDLRDAWT